MTYNQIVKLLRDFADAHFIIKSFGNGEPWELVENSQAKDLEYPMMWAQDLPNTIVKGEEAFKFRMYFLGQVASVKQKTEPTLGETNINEVKSDMRQCATDLASFLVQDKTNPDIDSTRDITLTSFTDDFNDKLTGWYFDLTISQSFSFSACNIPMDGIIPPPSEVCADANQIIKDSNGLTLYTNSIPSGATEIQVISDVTNTFNGGSIVGTVAQGNKDIIVETDDVVPVQIGTAIVNTNQELRIQITSSPVSVDVYYQRPDINNVPQTTLYDEGWMRNNNFDVPFIIPTDAVYQKIDYSVNADYLIYNNKHGHKFRLCGLNGGYFDFNDSLYKDINGALSSFLIEFAQPVGSTGDIGYIEDLLTGLGYKSKRGGLANQATTLVNGQAATDFGFTDWMSLTASYLMTLYDWGNVNSLFNQSRPFQVGTIAVWTATVTPYAPTTASFKFAGRESVSVQGQAVLLGLFIGRLAYGRNEFVTQ